MNKTLLSQSMLAGLLTLASSAAFAADYYVVAPLPGKQHLVDGISVALNATPLPTGVVGVPYAGFNLSTALQVNGDPAYSSSNVGWSVVAGALPAGLTLNKGVISGTPTAAGAQAFTVRATYKTKTGEQAYQLFTYAVTVALATGVLPQGVVGVAYPTYDLKPLLAVQGDPSFNPANVVWTVVSNTLPAGLTLKANGTIAGTPTASGTGSVTARASYKGVNGEQTYQVVTLGITVALTGATLPQGVAGVAYPTQDLKSWLTIEGDPSVNLALVTWTVVSNTLPAGLTLKADGTLSGTPTAAGTGAITARASYKGVNGEQTYQVVTLGVTVALAAATLPQAIVGQAYSYDVKTQLAVGGDGAYNVANVAWSVASGTLPAGLALNASTGVLSGTPTAASSGNVVLRASYKGINGEQTYQVVSLNIVVSLANATLPDALEGTAYSYDFKPLVSASGDPSFSSANVTFSLSSSSAPAGMGFTAAGVLSGTPTTAIASHPLSVVASYRGKTGTTAYTMKVAPAPYAINYLVVAGGGGGGHANGNYAGGGGAGGFLQSTLTVAFGTQYPVTVGAGGGAATNGQNSSFASSTAVGGGAGASYTGAGAIGNAGGSGGGAAPTYGNGGNGTAGQGNRGGNSSSANQGGSDSAGGGGGGAGAGGDTQTGYPYSNTPGPGGAGMQSDVSGVLTWYAAGGGGSGTYVGSRQNGIGGSASGVSGWNGSVYLPWTSGAGYNGTENTGSGGAAGRANLHGGGNNPGSGGSGVVIISQPATAPVATTTGSPVVTVVGAKRIYKFNASGTIKF